LKNFIGWKVDHRVNNTGNGPATTVTIPNRRREKPCGLQPLGRDICVISLQSLPVDFSLDNANVPLSSIELDRSRARSVWTFNPGNSLVAVRFLIELPFDGGTGRRSRKS